MNFTDSPFEQMMKGVRITKGIRKIVGTYKINHV